MSLYRVEDKQNIIRHGRMTMFHLYKKQGNAYLHQGAFAINGHNATDERCIAEALDKLDEIDMLDMLGE